VSFDGYSFDKVDVDGLIWDSFAGGGGWSKGIEMATGRSPDYAANHDPQAIAMHSANHKGTAHFCESVWRIHLEKHRGQRVRLAVFSPDCKDFSKAKGGKPVDKGIRGLAWFVVKFCRILGPDVFMVENVEEWPEWCPLGPDGKRIEERLGETFRSWWAALERLGYHLEMKELSAHDYGAPTIRKRVFVIGRRDKQPIVWPEPTHGPGRAFPHRVAAECIDFTIPILSIFATHKRALTWSRAWRKAGVPMWCPVRPLAIPTRRRIAHGIQRFVIDDEDPYFITPVTHAGDDRVHSAREPFRTITGAHRGELALVAPTLIQTGYGEREGQRPRFLDIRAPLGTLVGCGQRHALVAAFMARHNGERDGGFVGGASVQRPSPALTARNNKSIVAVHMTQLKGSCVDGKRLTEPMPGLCAEANHMAAVATFMTRYNGVGIGSRAREPMHTITSKDRFGVVTVHVGGDTFGIADIGMRMMWPRELFRAQGFPDSYLIGDGEDGLKLTKEDQVRMVGNSVAPPVAAALIAANLGARARVAA
jgi:DNA (cytosine-5)-methyltransferase 1